MWNIIDIRMTIILIYQVLKKILFIDKAVYFIYIYIYFFFMYICVFSPTKCALHFVKDHTGFLIEQNIVTSSK